MPVAVARAFYQCLHWQCLLTDKQVSVLLATQDRVLHSALLFGLLTGMRSGEICGLMAEDVSQGKPGKVCQHQAQQGSSAEVQGCRARGPAAWYP